MNKSLELQDKLPKPKALDVAEVLASRGNMGLSSVENPPPKILERSVGRLETDHEGQPAPEQPRAPEDFDPQIKLYLGNIW